MFVLHVCVYAYIDRYVSIIRISKPICCVCIQSDTQLYGDE